MTIELTHEQAAYLRTVLQYKLKSRSDSDQAMIESLHGCVASRIVFIPLDNSWVTDCLAVTDLGREALAAYDAKWCVVPRYIITEFLEHANSGLESAAHSAELRSALREHV